MSILFKLLTGADQAQGPDVSHWDLGFDPSKATQRIDFAFMKLTEGTLFVDSLIDEIWEGVKQVAVRGGYHYQRSGMSWQLQADHFLKFASKYDFQVYILDLEDTNNKYDDTFFADARRIIDRWRTKAPTKKILLYTNWDTYKQLYYAITRLYPDGKTWLDDLDFWYAWPSSILPAPILPTQRKTWKFWQWSWAGKKEEWGTLSATDLNVFNGSVEEMKQWAGITDQPPSDDDPNPDDEETGGTMDKKGTAQVTANIRDINNDPVGKLYKGDVVYGEVRTAFSLNRLFFRKVYRVGGLVQPWDEGSNTAVADDGGTVILKVVDEQEPGTPAEEEPDTPVENEAVLDIVVTNPTNGKKYGGTGIKLPEIP